MKFISWSAVLGAMLFLDITSAASFEVGHILNGQARIIDGDTLEIAGSRVRLNGVAAPERDEAGGPEATQFMETLTDGQTIRCSLTGEKTYQREVGTCWIGTTDIGGALIAAGLARDCPRYSGGRYAALETSESQTLPLPDYCRPRR